jgi:hypothetical protein
VRTSTERAIKNKKVAAAKDLRLVEIISLSFACAPSLLSAYRVEGTQHATTMMSLNDVQLDDGAA